MPANSLVFLVIVAIWAAYLLQYWIRRREQAASTRSVDGFTRTMRVLERRSLVPNADLREPRPHSYTVALGRGARPSLDVKRARPAGTTGPIATAASLATSPDATGANQSRAHLSSANHSRANLSSANLSSANPASPTVTDPAPEASPMPTFPPARPASSRPGLSNRRAKQARGILLLVALAWVPVSIVLAATGTISWLTLPFAILMVVAVLFWLRTEAMAEQAARATRARDVPVVLSSEETQEIAPEHLERVRRVATAPAAPRASRDYQAGQGSGRAATRTSASIPFDANAESAESARSAQPAASATASARVQNQDVGGIDVASMETAATGTEDAAPGTWSPRPVPPPTYTMKARAPEPKLTSYGIPADVFDTPEFADEAEELDERALFARRAANG